MDQNVVPPRRPRRFESGVRRTVELCLLALSLLVGLPVIAGCGGLLMFASGAGYESMAPITAAGVLAVGVVYLYVSMSRDARILRQQLLDRERRSLPADRSD